MSLRPKAKNRARAAGIPAAGSVLLLLAAICSAYVVPEGRSAQAMARGAVAGLKSSASPGAKSRILSRFSFHRRQAVRSDVRALFAGLFSLPPSASVPSAAAGASRISNVEPPIATSSGALRVFIQRPPPAA